MYSMSKLHASTAEYTTGMPARRTPGWPSQLQSSALRCPREICAGNGEYPTNSWSYTTKCRHCHITYMCSHHCLWMMRYHEEGAHCMDFCWPTPVLLPAVSQQTSRRPSWAEDTTLVFGSVFDMERPSGLKYTAPATIMIGSRIAPDSRGSAPWPLAAATSALSIDPVVYRDDADPELCRFFLGGPIMNTLQLRARFDTCTRTLWAVVLEIVAPCEVESQTDSLLSHDIGPAAVRTTWVPFCDLSSVVMVRWGGFDVNPSFGHGDGNLLAGSETDASFGGPDIFRGGVFLAERKIKWEWERERRMRTSKMQ